jgi:F-type H+-transporting ATPase subunit b
MAATTHTEVPPEPRQFPPFRKDTIASQLFWFTITFVVLLIVVSRRGLPRIGGIIQARKGRIAADLAAANQLKEGADAAMAAYEKALSEARTRAQAIAGETHHRLNSETEATRKTLEHQLSAKQAEADKTIAATKAAALQNVRGIAIDAAGAIVARLAGASPAQANVAQAVDAVLKH